MMGFHDGAGDRQAKAKTFARALLALLHLMEGVEYFLFMGIINARTGIGNADQSEALCGIG